MREPISPATSSSGTTGPGSTPDSATSLPKKYSTSGQKASEWRRNRQFNRSEIFGADPPATSRRWRSETAYTVTDLSWQQIRADQLAEAIRAHWHVENRLHWI